MSQRSLQQDGSSTRRFGRSRARLELPVGRRIGLALPLAFALALALTLLALAFPLSPKAAKAADAAGFQDTVAIGSGLDRPINVEFSKDGRVFVADKSGLITVFDSLSDTTPTIFADLRTQVMNNGDRGLLGLALDPNFPTSPYVYVLYTHDAPIGGAAPRWGQPNTTSDPCPTLPGPTTDGCVVSGHLSKLTASGNTMTGSEQVLIEGWCQQFNSHSLGDLAFGSDGALYVSAGEGAGYDYADYGQGGGDLQNTPTPKNPCGDPPTGVGGTQTPPTAEGGALRSQDLRTSGDPVSLDGTILRVDPQTGQALPNNPLIGNTDPNARRIIADGRRNPFRFAKRPGTNEVWIGNVGWHDWEEINRIASPTDSTVETFGWLCYEGPEKQADYDATDPNICENLYSAGPSAVVTPYYAYKTTQQIVPGETCGTGSQALSGVTFYEGGSYPAKYNGALFFSDYVRGCIWVMEKGTNGLPDPTKITNFISVGGRPSWTSRSDQEETSSTSTYRVRRSTG